MAWTVSPEIEDALWSAAERHLPVRVLGGRVLGQAVIARSRLYTSERELLALPGRPGSGSAEAADLAARALFFAVADAPKIHVPLAELAGLGLLPDGDPLEILDIGAGAGAMTLGTLDYLHRTGALRHGRVMVRAVDRDAAALNLFGTAAADLGRRWGISISVAVEHADVTAPVARNGAHLVLAGSVLNELPGEARPALVRSLLAAMAPGGAMIAIEPALRATARDLHGLRDWILEHGLARVVAPCTRQAAPCPALAGESDWCHEDRPTRLPPRAARLAAATGLRTHGLKFAYLALCATGAPSPWDRAEGSAMAALRVVSQPQKSKGKRECFVCSDAGRHQVRLMGRRRSADSRAFEDALRGDVLLTPARLAHGGDLEEGDPVTAVHATAPGHDAP